MANHQLNINNLFILRKERTIVYFNTETFQKNSQIIIVKRKESKLTFSILRDVKASRITWNGFVHIGYTRVHTDDYYYNAHIKYIKDNVITDNYGNSIILTITDSGGTW